MAARARFGVLSHHSFLSGAAAGMRGGVGWWRLQNIASGVTICSCILRRAASSGVSSSEDAPLPMAASKPRPERLRLQLQSRDQRPATAAPDRHAATNHGIPIANKIPQRHRWMGSARLYMAALLMIAPADRSLSVADRVVSRSSPTSAPGIFDDDPFVVVTDPRGFLHRIVEAKTPTLVNFYSPMCPHCRAYAPTVAAIPRSSLARPCRARCQPTAS